MEGEKQEISFAQLRDELDKGESALEEGGISLGRAVDIYEEGMLLAEEAGKRLSDTELRITRIKEKYENAIGEQHEIDGDHK